MEIRETKQRNLKLLEEGVRTTKKGIRFVRQNLDPFGTEQEEEDDREEGGLKKIDPARFMNRKEEREWNRLSERKQSQYIRQGIREAGSHRPQQKTEEKISQAFREGTLQQGFTESTGVMPPGSPYGAPCPPAFRPVPGGARPAFFPPGSGRNGYPASGRNENGFRKNHEKQMHDRPGEQPGASGADTRHPGTGRGNIPDSRGGYPAYGEQGGGSTQGTPVNSASQTQTAASTGQAASTGMASGSAASVSAGAVSTTSSSVMGGGVGIAVSAGKKTAETFRESLTAHAMAAQQAQQKMQGEETFGALPKPAAYAVTAVSTALASLAAVAVQLVSTLFTAVLAVITSILPVIALICTVTVLITSILTVLTSSNSAGYDLPAFITEEMMESFFEEQEESGFPVSSGVAQLIAESGFGLYGPGGESGEGLSRLAYDYKNMFGIKYFSGDRFATGAVNMQTGEEVNGGNVEIIAGFSVYPDYKSCIRQRSWMLAREPYVSNISAYLNQNDKNYTKEEANDFVRGIQRSGWATSSVYAERCIEHMETYNLYQFDNMTYEEYKSGMGGGSYNGVVTPSMQRIAEVAESNTGTYPCTPDMCAAWVTGVYQAAGAPVLPYGNAIDMWNSYRSTGSTGMENIPPGAIVCGSGSGYMGSLYGHVGVYLGNGMVAHNAGYHSIQTLEEWCSWQTAVCQGHQGWIGWVFPGGVPTE